MKNSSLYKQLYMYTLFLCALYLILRSPIRIIIMTSKRFNGRRRQDEHKHVVCYSNWHMMAALKAL